MAAVQTSGSSGKSEKPSVQDRLKNLLEIESVQKIYVVDEQVSNDYDFEDFSALVRAARSAGKSDELEDIETVRDYPWEDLDIALAQIRGNWDNWKAAQRREVTAAVASLTDVTFAADAQQAGKLNTLFDEDLVEYFHPDDWNAQKETILSGLQSPQKIVVLFDEELDQEDKRKGRDLIQEVKDQGWQGKIVPVLFTNLITTYQEELPKRDEIIGQMTGALSTRDFFALSKKRSDDGEDFADGIKKSLLNSYCEQIKAASVAVLEKAFQYAIAEVQKLDTYHFDDVVLRSSYKEGVWEALTFQRIAQIFYDDGVHQEMQSQNYLSRVNKEIRASKKIRGVEFKPAQVKPYLQKFELRHREIYLDGSIINQLNFPVENGDIFEIDCNSTKLQFILVGQECDLAIRTDANKPEDEGTRKLKVGILLKIDSTPTSKLDKYGMNFQLDYFSKETNKHAFAEFKDSAYVSMDFLDLTVFDSKGKAQLNLSSKDINGELFSFAWESRYGKIWDFLKAEIAAANKLVEQLPSKRKNALAQKIFPPFSFPDNLLTPKFDINKISLPIQRVKRLRAPHSKFLLEKYTRYQSRAADLHDFAR